jgi:hypothetical protein
MCWPTRPPRLRRTRPVTEMTERRPRQGDGRPGGLTSGPAAFGYRASLVSATATCGNGAVNLAVIDSR